jgi:hypothetical protein
MALRFIGIDPNTGTGESPTVWVDEEKLDLVVQSYTDARRPRRPEPSPCPATPSASPTARP